MQLYAAHFGKPQSTQNCPIIILHGLFGSHRNWHPIAKALAKDNTVYALDLRNHGKSPHSELMDYPLMAEDIEQFIEHHQLGQVRIIAHSMGGKAAMWFALSRPDMVQKLVVVDIAPVTYKHDFSDVLNAFESIPLDTIKSRAEADKFLSATISERSLRQFLLQNLQLKHGHYEWRLNLVAIRDSMKAITGFPDTNNVLAFNKRVLFVGGGQSDYLSRDRQKLTRKLFPMASFSMIKNAGHWLHSEQPALFQSLIKAYLE